MNLKNIFIFTSIIFLSFSLYAQQAQRFSATKANEYGLSYSLPNTALTITVEAELIEREAGEFYKYAGKYLNEDNPIVEDSKAIRLKSVVLSTHGVPNTDERYLITLKSSQAPFIMLSEDNILLSVNSDKIMPVKEKELPEAQPTTISPLKSDAARQVISEEMIMSHSTAKKAELAAKQIYEIRQTRSDMLTGQADQMPPDGQALRMVLDNLNSREEALVAMFMGAETTSTQVRSFTIVPEDDITRRVICRLSAVNGIVDSEDLSGIPLFLSLNIETQGELPVNDKGERLAFPKGGVAYTIPGKARVIISFEGKEINNEVFDFAQFGVVYGMAPSNFTDKKAPVYLMLDPATGAAIEVGPAKL